MEKSVIQQSLEDMGIETLSYSGRGMYGESCLGFVTDLNPLYIGFMICRADKNEDIDESNFFNVKSDNMGLSMVYYFPNIPYVESEGDSEND
jgi:hypothetical protein